MSKCMSPCSTTSPGNRSTKITTNWLDSDQRTDSIRETVEEGQSSLYSISENMFGLYCSEKVDHHVQQESIRQTIDQLKINRVDAKIKIFCLIRICDVISKYGNEFTMVPIDLFKPPQLLPMVKFCEKLFDWLIREGSNIALFYFNTDATVLLTVVYAYSCYYDSLQRRDIRISFAIKSFLNLFSKTLEKVPVSYRRYAGYMSLYSCMNQLQSYHSSVKLYCLILYNLPAMESNKNSTSQLFFKIYTNEPMKCSHTTKLYCLPRNVNRLVILFDQYPIILRNDTMILCYHVNLGGGMRTKILRLNFHTCQVTNDVLTFYGQDFDEIYPGCPLKIKLDLYFQATAVFGQGEANFTCDNSHWQSSQLERYDSYQSLSATQADLIRSYSTSVQNKNLTRSTMVEKTNVRAQCDIIDSRIEEKVIKKEVLPETVAPTTTKESTKSESTLTKLSSNNIVQAASVNNSKERQKITLESGMDEQTCITTINTIIEPQPLAGSCSTKDNVPYRDNKGNESLLMSELLEAQKEISSLRQSLNNTENLDSLKTNNKSNIVSQGFTKDTNCVTDRVNSATEMTNQQDYLSLKSQNEISNTNQHLHIREKTTDSFIMGGDVKSWSYSTNKAQAPQSTDAMSSENQRHRCYANDFLEEIETINLQPIGRGIQDLNNGPVQGNLRRVYSQGESDKTQNISLAAVANTSIKLPVPTKIYSNSPLRIQTSPRQNELTLRSVEDRMQWWYQPSITREEAIVILKLCEQGSFLIRDSTTYSGAYGLAVKVASVPANVIPKSDDIESEKVRHYLIESLGSQGVCFKGFQEEPIFPTLTQLVLFYIQTLSVLPCLLKLPDKPLTEISTQTHKSNSIIIFPQNIKSDMRNVYSVNYLGCYDPEYITGPSIINKAIERLFQDVDPRMFTECLLKIIPDNGIEITDVKRKLFLRRRHSFSDIIFCALDPRNRRMDLDVCKSKGMRKTRIFGIIVKNYGDGENKCLLFTEFDRDQKANTIVKAICENLHGSKLF